MPHASMRRLALLLLGLAAVSVEAQGVVPDTTDPARYAPLATGDVRHYRDVGGLSTYREARRVLRDSTIRDTTYAVVEVRGYPGAFGGRAEDAFSVAFELLRFDLARATLRQRSEGREVNAFYAPGRLPPRRRPRWTRRREVA